jgi:small subunit ribosomal protein S5
VPAAIQKGVEEAKKNFFTVPMIQRTIAHPAIGQAGAGRVLVKPAAPGTGVIAGGPVRAVLECAGVCEGRAKPGGPANPINVLSAPAAAGRAGGAPAAGPRLRGLELEELLPRKMLDNLRA